MDVKDLKYFVAVYETKTFSRASEFLGTVQSNVSARIRSLEDALGAALFERHYRGVVPTLKGEELYARAKELIATFEVTERALKVRAMREDGRAEVRAHEDLTAAISTVAHDPPGTEDNASEQIPLRRDELRERR